MTPMTITMKTTINNNVVYDNEEYLALIGRWLTPTIWVARGKNPIEGGPVSVKFNAQDIIDREIAKGDIMGFYHTHPKMPASPSSTDYNTMNGWVASLGKDLVCLIEGENGLKTYLWVDDDAFVKGKTIKIGNLFIGYVPSVQYP